jgi:AcrR family transcriptional regulator
MTTSRKRGRRPRTKENTRLAIKRAAKDSLAKGGSGRPTLRTIAERAGVDQALVLYYFGSMDGLYSELALDGMRELLDQKVLGSPTSPHFGSSLITAIFDGSRSSSSGLPFETLFYGAIAGPQFRPLLAKLISEEMPERLSLDRRSKRDQLAVSLLVAQILGLGVVRYILKLEPVASASIQTIAKEYGPSLNLVLSRTR